jgi:beta-lactamase class A
MDRLERLFRKVKVWVRTHKRQIGLGALGFVGLIILTQLFYPSDKLTPFASVDGVKIGGWQKKDAAKALDAKYKAQPIAIYFGKNKTAHYNPLPDKIGLTVKNTDRLSKFDYPWYLRLVPSSILWQAALYPDSEPTYDRSSEKLSAYMKTELGDSCDVKPVNASLKADGSKLVLVPASSGGTCKLSDVSSMLNKVTPHLPAKPEVRIATKEILPTINDSDAKKLATTMNAQLDKGVNITAGNAIVKADSKAVASWLDFKAADDKLVSEVNTTRAADYFNKELAPKVTVAAGVTKVATLDFQETSRQNGANGQALDPAATGAAIIAYLTAQKDSIAAATQPVAPRVEYTRAYSPTDTGLSALMANYAKDHPGTYGVQMIELSGKRRRAAYNESKQFVTASTYKLFVAYGTLKKIESNEWQWPNPSAGGRDTAACFDDMIVKSDNACAEALLARYGYNNLTRDIRALGLSGASGFIGDTPKSTAADLGLFMAMLESGQMPIQPASRDRFLGALKRNIYRQGIPAGANGQVADKVGFLNGLFHDAAIVYSPNGTYVLVIMTDGSSWANIAELTKQIDALRSQ